MNETNGSWGNAIDVPGTGADSTVNSVSCATAGNCTAGGDFEGGTQALVANESNGGADQPGVAARPKLDEQFVAAAVPGVFRRKDVVHRAPAASRGLRASAASTAGDA